MTAASLGRTDFGADSPLYQSAQLWFRGCLSRFATGVAVITFGIPSGRHGLTINSFVSVSLDPPLVLVSLRRSARARDLMRGRPFTVNILGAEQQELAMHFAGRPTLIPQWIEGCDAPRLDGVLGYLECAPWAEYEAGDHTLFVGEVKHFDYRSGDALGFINGTFAEIPENCHGHESLF